MRRKDNTKNRNKEEQRTFTFLKTEVVKKARHCKRDP